MKLKQAKIGVERKLEDLSRLAIIVVESRPGISGVELEGELRRRLRSESFSVEKITMLNDQTIPILVDHGGHGVVHNQLAVATDRSRNVKR